MHTENLVSILMTCYNGELYLKDAINSIINQRFKNWELIFYDNSSTDRSNQIVKNFKDKRIKYFKSDKLLNLGEIRSLAFSKSTGKYVAFLDVDDIWHEEKLGCQISKFEKNENVDIVYCDYNKINSKMDLIETDKQNYFSGHCQKEIIQSYINGKPLTAWLTLMIKSKKINQLEYSFDKNLHITSDFDLILRLSEFCYFDYVPQVLCSYRVHDKNESSNKKKEINELFYIINKFKKNKLIKKYLSKNLFSTKIKIKKFFFDLSIFN